ncbi:hypothetical protein DPEC_G00176260 [Dallia pectoralis]|uniref:Uncharacterized protein n=1 Tax=Dallia pectoralis TaxID=75939 RepID=A0ACC2GEZ4_DALPE|nr:hypothetical protein DPEC_G00176260 [Dallia pectoralis]
MECTTHGVERQLCPNPSLRETFQSEQPSSLYHEEISLCQDYFGVRFEVLFYNASGKGRLQHREDAVSADTFEMARKLKGTTAIWSIHTTERFPSRGARAEGTAKVIVSCVEGHGGGMGKGALGTSRLKRTSQASCTAVPELAAKLPSKSGISQTREISRREREKKPSEKATPRTKNSFAVFYSVKIVESTTAVYETGEDARIPVAQWREGQPDSGPPTDEMDEFGGGSQRGHRGSLKPLGWGRGCKVARV